MASKRFRNFSLVTYCSPEQVQAVMHAHDKQLKAYAYILHDKDTIEIGELKTSHCHVIVSLVNNTTCEAVRNWFRGFVDNRGLPVNTLAQSCHDIFAAFDYLTHNTEQAKSDGKYLYSDSDIVGFNLDFFKDDTKQEIDNLTLAITDMLNGVPLADVLQRYGRDFIVHYGHIKMLYNDIQKQIGGEQL